MHFSSACGPILDFFTENHGFSSRLPGGFFHNSSRLCPRIAPFVQGTSHQSKGVRSSDLDLYAPLVQRYEDFSFNSIIAPLV